VAGGGPVHDRAELDLRGSEWRSGVRVLRGKRVRAPREPRAGAGTVPAASRHAEPDGRAEGDAPGMTGPAGTNREREALRSFARRIDPSDAGAHNNLGVLYYNKGLYEDAVA